MLTTKSPLPEVAPVNGIPTTTSLNVARVFEKEHRTVLRDIDNLLQEVPQDWGVHNFVQTLYTHKQNKQQYPMYTLTRDGFTLLAMGFTGKKAMQFKIAYINAFNEMEAKLREQAQPKALPSPQLPPAKPKLPKLMFEYSPTEHDLQAFEKFCRTYKKTKIKERTYNMFMLRQKYTSILSDMEWNIKQLHKDLQQVAYEPLTEVMRKSIADNSVTPEFFWGYLNKGVRDIRQDFEQYYNDTGWILNNLFNMCAVMDV